MVGVSAADDPRRPELIARRDEPVILRLIAPLAVLVVAATAVCWVLGFVLARQSDDRADSQNRQALRGAIERLAASPGLSHLNPETIRVLERAAGLQDLRFDDEPPLDSGAMLSLINPEGRIIGWFSWQPERPATTLMKRLLPLAALISLGLLGFAVLAMWQLSRFGVLLDQSARKIHRLAFEDAVTGLPNLHQMRAFLDYALARRSGRESLAFALIDLGGFDDMKDAVGEGSEDEVLNEIADRLRHEMPAGVLVARLRGDKFGVV